MAEPSFTRLFLAGVRFRSVLASVAMGLAFLGSWIGGSIDWTWAPFVGACTGLLIGIAFGRWAKPRWDPLNRVPESIPADFPMNRSS